MLASYFLDVHRLFGPMLWTANVISLFDIEFQKIEHQCREFVEAVGLPDEISFEAIFQSTKFGSVRQVFKVTIAGQIFALKYDSHGGETGRLRAEFAIVQRLFEHFKSQEKVAVPEPMYLSPSGEFFVLRYVGDRLATTTISNDANSTKIGQVYRRAGLWLHHLHDCSPKQEVALFPNWMLEAVSEHMTQDPQADPETLNRHLDVFAAEAAQFQGRSGLKVLSHGDFHTSNMILAPGVTYGFDFTETAEKLAEYDIVDFLKSDVLRRDDVTGVDRSGVSRHCKDMFLKGYRHPVDLNVLDFCLRGRLLIDWSGITQARYAKSAFQRNKFHQLEKRLRIAFEAHPRLDKFSSA